MNKYLKIILELNKENYIKWWLLKHYRSFINRIIALKQTTPLTLNGTILHKLLQIIIYGKTEQESTTGKNLLPVESTISFTRFTRINVSLPAGTYIITNEGRNTVANNSAISANDQIKGTFSSSVNSITFTISTDITSIGLYSSSNYGDSENITCEYSNLMLRNSSITDDTYEPYTGRNTCT